MKEAICSQRCHRWASGATVVVMLETANIFFFLNAGVLIISFGYTERESSSLFFVGFIVVVKEIITAVDCDFCDM